MRLRAVSAPPAPPWNTIVWKLYGDSDSEMGCAIMANGCKWTAEISLSPAVMLIHVLTETHRGGTGEILVIVVSCRSNSFLS